MRRGMITLAIAIGTSAFACSSEGSPTGDTTQSTVDGGRLTDAASDADSQATFEVDAAGPAPTWTQLYTNYFGPGTPGHCGKCHEADPNKQLRVGTTKESFYSGLIDAGLIDTEHTQQSIVGDPLKSPLAWFNGPMPEDQAVPNPGGAWAVKRWVMAGALNN